MLAGSINRIIHVFIFNFITIIIYVYLIMAKKSLFEKEGKYALLLQGLLVFYIICATSPPPGLADLISSPLGYVMVVICALAAFAAAGPVTGTIALVAAYVLLDRSNAAKTSPAEIQQDSLPYQEANVAGYTLEERVVAEMVPPEDAKAEGSPSYVPVLNPMHGLGAPVGAGD